VHWCLLILFESRSCGFDCLSGDVVGHILACSEGPFRSVLM
jgi:hypothetical protein